MQFRTGGTLYDGLFFDYIEQGAISSAREVIRVLKPLPITSVLDVGCGRGAWLSEWTQAGVPETIGVDGHYVELNRLLIPNSSFHARDITQEFDLERKFDLVQCLEVGEHLPPDKSVQLVDNLTRHGDLIMFSAAVPGQGGLGHINERPLSFWQNLFSQRDYYPFDWIRIGVAGNSNVEPWYRFNSILYVHKDRIDSLPEAIVSQRIDRPIPNLSNIGWRLRCSVLRQLPVATVSALASIKHRFMLMKARQS